MAVGGIDSDAKPLDREVAAEIVLTHKPEVVVGLAELVTKPTRVVSPNLPPCPET